MEQHLVADILFYLSKATSGDAESMEVALQCLADATSAEVPVQTSNGFSLLDIYTAGVEALTQQQTAKQEEESNPAFVQFLQALKTRGYFNGVEEGSEEYSVRLQKAKEKFTSKFAAAPAPSPEQKAVEEARKKALAEEKKSQGNELLKRADFSGAVQLYTEAIDLNDQNAVYYANRAAARLHLEQFAEAEEDGLKASQVNPSYTKGFLRLAMARFHLEKWDESVEAYEAALALSPGMADDIRSRIQLVREKQNPSQPVQPQQGMPDLSALLGSLGGGGDAAGGLAGMMNNPMFKQMADSVMSNPNMMSEMQNLMGNPGMMQNMMNMMGGGGGASAPGASEEGLADLMSDPRTMEILQDEAKMQQVMQTPAMLTLRQDPTISPVFDEMEASGPQVLIQYLKDPQLASKFMGAFKQGLDQL